MAKEKSTEEADKADPTAPAAPLDPVAAALAAVKVEAETKKAIAEAYAKTTKALIPGADVLPVNSIDASKAGTAYALTTCFLALSTVAVKIGETVAEKVPKKKVWIDAPSGASPLATAHTVDQTISMLNAALEGILGDLRPDDAGDAPGKNRLPPQGGKRVIDVDDLSVEIVVAALVPLLAPVAAILSAGLPVLTAALSSTRTVTGASATLGANAVLNSVIQAVIDNGLQVISLSPHMTIDQGLTHSIDQIEAQTVALQTEVRKLAALSRAASAQAAPLVAKKGLLQQVLTAKIAAAAASEEAAVDFQQEIDALVAVETQLAGKAEAKAVIDERITTASAVLTRVEAAVGAIQTVGDDGFSPMMLATFANALPSAGWVRLEVAEAAAGHETIIIDKKLGRDKTTYSGMVTVTFRLTDSEGVVVAAGNQTADRMLEAE